MGEKLEVVEERGNGAGRVEGPFYVFYAREANCSILMSVWSASHCDRLIGVPVLYCDIFVIMIEIVKFDATQDK